MFKIIIIPGFQQERVGFEYRLDSLKCERIRHDHTAKKSAPVANVCHDQVVSSEIHRRFEQLDWVKVLNLEEYNTVDDAEQIVFIGDFGRVTIPVKYLLDNKKLEQSERQLCLLLDDLLKTIETLNYYD